MTDHAPRPEGMTRPPMSNGEIEAVAESYRAGLIEDRIGALIAQINYLNDLVRRLRADAATLRGRIGAERVGIVLEIQRALGVEPSGDMFERIAELVKAEADAKTLRDAAEMLWVVLANVSGGNWKEQSADWQEAAARWRDNYFTAIRHPPAKGNVDVGASAPKEPMTTPEPSTLSEQELKALEEYTWSLVCCVCDGPDPYGNHDDDCQAPFWQKIRRAIAQARAARPSPWQPIETAPKDGTHFIAWTNRGQLLFTAHWGGQNFLTEYEQWRGTMTHWMPLPSPPAQGRA